MEHSERESICQRCGRCCFQKMLLDDEIVYLPYPCAYLDLQTRLCTVYNDRHHYNPDCLTIEDGISMGVFPADCPYVNKRPGYRPPREQATEEECELYLDWLDNEDSK